MRVAVVDYGLANLRSVVNALACFDVDVLLAERGEALGEAERVVLPGVGSFDAGMRGLRERGHDEALERRVREEGRPFLGICLGLQFLLEGSEEGAEPGLGWLPGRVRRFPGSDLKVPHMGWNEIRPARPGRLFQKLELPLDVYFVHSFYVPQEGVAAEAATAWCDYGGDFVAAVEVGAIHAVQFHPEKSQLAGMKLLETFLGEPC